MRLAPCYWMALWEAGKPASTWEHWLLRVGFSSLLLIVCFNCWRLIAKVGSATILGWARLTNKWSTICETGSRFLTSFRQRSKGITRYAPIWFCMFFGALVVMAVTMLPRDNVVTQHHVAVLGQLPDGDWAMESDEDSSLVFRVCPDDERRGVHVTAMFQKAIGYVADEAKWQERGECKSIFRSDLGFWFRDKNNNFSYERITNARASK